MASYYALSLAPQNSTVITAALPVPIYPFVSPGQGHPNPTVTPASLPVSNHPFVPPASHIPPQSLYGVPTGSTTIPPVPDIYVPDPTVTSPTNLTLPLDPTATTTPGTQWGIAEGNTTRPLVSVNYQLM